MTGSVTFHLKYWLKLTNPLVASTCMLLKLWRQCCRMTTRLEIECRQLRSELFGRRHSTLQSHGLFSLAERCFHFCHLDYSTHCRLDVITTLSVTSPRAWASERFQHFGANSLKINSLLFWPTKYIRTAEFLGIKLFRYRIKDRVYSRRNTHNSNDLLLRNAVVTCETKLFQNYFSLRHHPSKKLPMKLYQNYLTGLLQLMNIFQHAHCRWNSFEIILEFFLRLK